MFDVELVDDENDASGLWHVWRGRILLPKATFPMVEDLKTLTRTEDGAKFTISKPTDGRLGYWICQAVGRVQHKRGTL